MSLIKEKKKRYMYIYILEDQNIEGKRYINRLQRINAPCSNKDIRTNVDGTPMV